MGDKEDVTPPQPKSAKNDKEAQRLESQYDILVPELYPLIAQQHQIKLEEEEDPYEKVTSFVDCNPSELSLLTTRKKTKAFVPKPSLVFGRSTRSPSIWKNG